MRIHFAEWILPTAFKKDQAMLRKFDQTAEGWDSARNGTLEYLPHSLRDLPATSLHCVCRESTMKFGKLRPGAGH